MWLSVGNLPSVSEPSLSSITIYQLRVVLSGVSPLVWRRLLVASDTESVKKSGVKPPGRRVCDSKVRSRCPAERSAGCLSW